MELNLADDQRVMALVSSMLIDDLGKSVTPVKACAKGFEEGFKFGMETANRPIPVTERLPVINPETEESERVYAFNAEAYKWSNAWVVTYGGQSPLPEWFWEDDCLRGPATHWLPMPPKP